MSRRAMAVVGALVLLVVLAGSVAGVLLYKYHQEDLATETTLRAQLAADDRALCAPAEPRPVVTASSATPLNLPSEADLAAAIDHVQDALKDSDAVGFPCAYNLYDRTLLPMHDADAARCEALFPRIDTDLAVLHASLHATTPDLARAVRFETLRMRKDELNARTLFQLFGAEMVRAMRQQDEARAHAEAIDALVLARDLMAEGDLTDVFAAGVLVKYAMAVLASPKTIPPELTAPPLPTLDFLLARDESEMRTMTLGAYATPSCDDARLVASFAPRVAPGYVAHHEAMKAYREASSREPEIDAAAHAKYAKPYADVTQPMGIAPPP